MPTTTRPSSLCQVLDTKLEAWRVGDIGPMSWVVGTSLLFRCYFRILSLEMIHSDNGSYLTPSAVRPNVRGCTWFSAPSSGPLLSSKNVIAHIARSSIFHKKGRRRRAYLTISLPTIVDPFPCFSRDPPLDIRPLVIYRGRSGSWVTLSSSRRTSLLNLGLISEQLRSA